MTKSSNGRPEIARVEPPAAIPGGEFQIRGRNLARGSRPRVTVGDMPAQVVIGSESYVIARVPEGVSAGEIVVDNGEKTSRPWACDVGVQIADTLHPVANPALDSDGNVFATFSGSRGQKTQVSVFKIDLNYNIRPFLADIMNATGLAFDRAGTLYVSSRNDGVIYQVTPAGAMSVFAEGMGVATGMAFDDSGNLYVGDRSGTIFKIAPSRQIYVFATLEASISAYHLAVGADGGLFVSGPTTSSFDSIYRISSDGIVEVFYRGLGRPQGLAFDADDRLYVAASLGGHKGVVRIGADRKAEMFVSGPGIVGLAFTPSRALILATGSALYRLDVGIQGRPPTP